MDEPQTPGSGLQKLVGGVEVDIEYLDGRPERVKVRYLPMRQMARYLEVFQDEEATVELFCDKPKGWASTLCPDSYTAIADRGQELNLPLFRNWYRRLTARSEAINPGFLAKAQSEALKKLAENPPDFPSTSSDPS